jgi:hypothetical protein
MELGARFYTETSAVTGQNAMDLFTLFTNSPGLRAGSPDVSGGISLAGGASADGEQVAAARGPDERDRQSGCAC